MLELAGEELEFLDAVTSRQARIEIIDRFITREMTLGVPDLEAAARGEVIRYLRHPITRGRRR